VGMADVRGLLVACVFTGIRRGGLRCRCFFGPKGHLGGPSIPTNSLRWSPVVIHLKHIAEESM